MTRSLGRRTIAAAAMALAMLTQPVWAQDISDSHLAAAREAVDAIGATDDFDDVLPQAALALKNELIQKNANLRELIDTTVNETALALAARRADLEREAAIAYANVFTEEQLNEIAAFYNSETGQKLISDGPIVVREILRAADIWRNGIARDLARQVAEKLATAAPGAQPPAAVSGEAPAEGAAPEQPATEQPAEAPAEGAADSQ